MNLKKIISFSLWGDDLMYWNGAIENIHLAKKLYPGWKCRFYIDYYADKELIKKVEVEDCEIVRIEPLQSFSGLFWRFYAAEDADIMICRDADSRISQREVYAVNEWLESDKHFHIMRDHPHHHTLILGGMWGARNMEGITELINTYPYQNLKGTDQLFLAEQIYPQVKDSAMIHDSYNLYQDGTNFPSKRIREEFVGSVFDKNGKPVYL